MKESTSKLLHRLTHLENPQTYLSRRWEEPCLASELQRLLSKAGMSPADWIITADISRSYAYQILRNERRPGRDILLRTALALSLDLEQIQRLLALGSCGALYPRLRRDGAVIYALSHGLSLMETEELLISLPERSLYGKEG